MIYERTTNVQFGMRWFLNMGGRCHTELPLRSPPNGLSSRLAGPQQPTWNSGPVSHYCGTAFACVPGWIPECFFTCAIKSSSLVLFS